MTDRPSGRIDKQHFFAGGGEMGALMRAHDWAATPIGAPHTWPQSLRTAVRILLMTQHPMFIWWGPDLIQFYNDAYRKTMGPERHASALGQRGRECWEEIWDIIGPQIEMVMRGEGATWHEDQLVPVTRHGKREDVWWTYSYGPIDDDTAPSGVGGVLVVCNDVTDRHVAFEALQVSQDRLAHAVASGMIGTWDWNIPANRIVADERFARLHNIDPVEAARGVASEKFIDAVHPGDLERVTAAIQAAIGGAGVFESEHRLVQADGSSRWVMGQGRCTYDASGQPARFTGSAFDITVRKEAELGRNLLAAELTHRVKNTLATVQAIASRTLRDDVPMREARDIFTARLLALSRMHDVLTGAGWVGATLRNVLAVTTEHLAGDANRIRIEGPAVPVSPRAALALAMTLHELCTNAVKYGALSTGEGRIDITWRAVPGAGGESLELRWRESGGPPVVPPTRKGFGSRLIEGALTAELGAQAAVRYDPAGVIWTLTAPVKNLAT